MEIVLRSEEIKRIIAKELSARLKGVNVESDAIELVETDTFSDRIRATIRLDGDVD